jgi:hypothetical protein
LASLALAADFVKVDTKKRIVEGYATTTAIDRDDQVMDEAWLRKAFPAWADRYGNVRYLHQPKVVGKVLSYEWKDNGYYITAKISDPKTWQQIEDRELNGFSIGIKGGKLVPDAVAKGGRYVDGEIIEVSVVDVPCNPQSDFMVIKSATFDIEKGVWLDDGDDMDDINLDWMCDGVSDADIDAYKRYYSAKERREMPESDFAGPHRSFPIRTQEDVDNAARLIGHAKDPEAVKRRIIEIARRKGFKIPEKWQKEEDANKTLDTSSGLQPYNLEGDNKRKGEKSTVADEKVTQEMVAEKTTDADFAKAADVAALRETMDGMVTTLTEILSKIEAMASQSDPDKDGDIDNDKHPEAEKAEDPAKGDVVHTAKEDAPNAIQDMLDNALKTVKADILKEVSELIDEKLNTVTKSATVDNDRTKELIAGVQKTVEALDAEVKKFVERLEKIEQSPEPAKGVTLVTEKFATTEPENKHDEASLLAEVTKTVRAKYPNATPAYLNHKIQEELAKRKGGNL